MYEIFWYENICRKLFDQCCMHSFPWSRTSPISQKLGNYTEKNILYPVNHNLHPKHTLPIFCTGWTARSMERSIFFFLKSHISAPGERNCPNFFSRGVFPSYFHVISDFCHIWGPFMAKIEKMCQKVPFWLSQAKITENDQPLPQLFRHPGAKNHTFRIFPAR